MRKQPVLLLIVSALLLAASPAAAQEEPGLHLGLSKDFGFRAGDRIQGKFTLQVSGPEDLEWVEFTIDERLIGRIGQAPFRLSFSTSEHALGWHTVAARGQLRSGVMLYSSPRRLEFVSAEEGWRAAGQIALPLVGVALALTLLGLVLPGLLGGRKGAYRVGRYGSAGGAVCPRCRLPYSRHMIAPNLLLGKLERCPHCGKWAVVARASEQALREAEARYRGEESTIGEGELAEKDRLRRMLDESRFLD